MWFVDQLQQWGRASVGCQPSANQDSPICHSRTPDPEVYGREKSSYGSDRAAARPTQGELQTQCICEEQSV